MIAETEAEDRIVQLSDRRAGAALHPALAQVTAYWEALRRGGALPRRAEIDPHGIDRALEYAFIAERIAPGQARFRLAGMHLNELMGMEVRGMPLSCLFEPVARAAVAVEVERAFAGPAAVELFVDSRRGIGRPALTGRLVLLPLRSESGEVARLLGALVAEGEPGKAPRRFQLTGATARRCPPAGPAAAEPGDARQSSPGGRRPAVRRGHLTLVHSAV